MYFLQTFQTIRQEQKQWEADNFGPPNAYHSTLGMIEEMGELAHSLLKKAQGIRGNAAEHEAAIIDALGDIGLYYISLLNATDTITPQDRITLTCEVTNNTIGRTLSAILGRLAYLTSCDFEAICQFDRDTIADILLPLNQLSHHITRLPIITHIETTWNNVVKKRDWKKNPQTGATERETPQP